ncbi:MAG: segregation/condensation protein A [Christensenellaceae bacterium]|jgi:segregation and condensation protein A|nr:segregation/condensation protein A [Christensenellaceae bacterium]
MSLIERVNENYTIVLSDFDGPLDLLLAMIKEQKLDIKTIKLGDMTKQFLFYLNGLDKLNMDLASEFVEVGATLVEIKSRQILPKQIMESEIKEDPEELLRQRLEEYMLFKEQSEKLKALENTDRFYKLPTMPKSDASWNLDGLTKNDLINAFVNILDRAGKTAAKIEKTTIKLDRFTIKGQIENVIMRLKDGGRVGFRELFTNDMTRSEAVNTFLALLELLKNQIAVAEQIEQFADIEIKRGDKYGTDYDTLGREFE